MGSQLNGYNNINTCVLGSKNNSSLNNSIFLKGGVIEQNAVPVLVSVATALSAVIITLSVVLAVTCTCWCKVMVVTCRCMHCI